jgi:hypothetical protein
MTILLNTITNQEMPDTTITLRNHIKAKYEALVNPSPPKDSVHFDTKFARLDFPNHIVVYPLRTEPEGPNRWACQDWKAIQVYCHGNSSLDNRFKLERHIANIINGNVLGMWDNGFIEAKITEFVPLSSPEQGLSGVEKSMIQSTNVARSKATILLKYEQYVGDPPEFLTTEGDDFMVT